MWAWKARRDALPKFYAGIVQRLLRAWFGTLHGGRMGAALAMHEVRTRQTQRQLLRSWLKASQQATARRETLCATAAATVRRRMLSRVWRAWRVEAVDSSPRTRVCMQRACHQPVNAAGGSVAACMAVRGCCLRACACRSRSARGIRPAAMPPTARLCSLAGNSGRAGGSKRSCL